MMVGWHHWLNGHEFEQARSWWWTGKPGVLQSMGSQRVRCNWVNELNWTGANGDQGKRGTPRARSLERSGRSFCLWPLEGACSIVSRRWENAWVPVTDAWCTAWGCGGQDVVWTVPAARSMPVRGRGEMESGWVRARSQAVSIAREGSEWS